MQKQLEVFRFFCFNTSAAGSMVLQEYFDFPPATATFVLGAYIGPWIALWCLEGIFERPKWHLEATKMEADLTNSDIS